MEAEFLSLMPHTVTLEAPSARDSYGAVSSWGDAVEVRALVVPGRRLVVNTQGEEIPARGVAHLAGPVTAVEGVYITVPSELGMPERMPVVSVRMFYDESATIHNVEVAF